MDTPTLTNHIDVTPKQQLKTAQDRAMCPYLTATAMLTEVARTNDEAIFHWATSSSSSQHTEVHLIKTLDTIQQLSSFIMQKLPPHHQNECSMRPSFVLPLTVRIDSPEAVSLTFNKAFLLKATILGDASITDSLSIAAAVVFYNIALFFQMKEAVCGVSTISQVMRYYELSNGILGQYIERTRRPVWSLQAAVLHNLDYTRTDQSMVPNNASTVYFEQLQAIVGYITDGEDMMFFKRAVAVAQMQLQQCCCATMA